jgi:hypothetical protein
MTFALNAKRNGKGRRVTGKLATRAGKNLSDTRRRELETAKQLLQEKAVTRHAKKR